MRDVDIPPHVFRALPLQNIQPGGGRKAGVRVHQIELGKGFAAFADEPAFHMAEGCRESRIIRRHGPVFTRNAAPLEFFADRAEDVPVAFVIAENDIRDLAVTHFDLAAGDLLLQFEEQTFSEKDTGRG